MIELKSKRSRIAASLGIAVLSIGILFFLLRGPYLSNYIKRIIVPQLENITQERIIIEKAVINLFPFYVQAKGLKVLDKDGNRLLWVTKSRAYIDLTGLFSGEIRVRKLTIIDPDMTADENDLKRIIGNVKKSASVGEQDRFKVSLKSISLTNGKLKYDDPEGMTGISGEGLFINMVAKETSVKVDVLLEKGTVRLPNHSELNGGFDFRVEVRNGEVEISEVNVQSARSVLNAKGNILISPEGVFKGGSLTGKAKIYVSTINEAFQLKQGKDGMLSFDGTVDMIPGKDSRWPGFVLDLKTDSSFYLETLMDIIDVDENIIGLVSVNGYIKGMFPEVTGKGFARLGNAVFDTFPLDDVTGEIEYRDRKFTLDDFRAHTYSGEIKGYAHITVPDGDYAVTADVSGINSLKLFKYIKWEPPFPEGKIIGDFSLNHEDGRDFEIAADINYLNDAGNDGDVFNRLRQINTSLDLKGDVLTFGNTVFSTSRSKLFLKGGIDFDKETLSLDLRLETKEVNDLTAPYYTRLNAPAEFIGRAGGALADPEISGKVDLGAGTIHGIPVSRASAGLKYRIASLIVQSLRIEQEGSAYDLSGLIEFRGAEGLFSFKSPFYKAKASLQNAGTRQFIKAAYRDVPVDGTVNGTISFEGDKDKFTGTGNLVFTDAAVYGQDLEKVVVKAVFEPDRLRLHSINAQNGKSELAAKGTIFYDGRFDMTASSDSFDTCDINIIEKHPLGARISLNISGLGTIDAPDIVFSSHIIESYFKEKQIGAGDMKGSFKGRDLRFNGKFVDGLVSADARASFSKKTIWNADIDIKRGRYDFLLPVLIDKVPDDISLFLEGNVNLRSQGSEHSIRSNFNYASLGIWGHDFTNDKDLVLEIVNRELFFRSFSFKGKNTDLYASGSVKFNEYYDVALKGNVDAAFLASASDRIESLQGLGSFNVNIKGKWESPGINGEINIEDTTAVLTDMPYRIGPLNGKFLLERDRVTFDSVRTGFAGGTVDMSGVGYLKKLALEKLYVSASLSEIKVRPLEKVNVMLGGSLFYETSPDGASITGNIDIKKAKYEKDVKFDKLLLGIKRMEGKKTGYPESLRSTVLNIHVEGKDNILIDNNIATTSVNISLNIMGTVEQYGLIGRVEAVGGNIYFRNNEFNILEGSSVEFVDPNSMAPVFHILAESYISDYYIKLTLDGAIDQFNLLLFSDPPLSETDMLTLLTFGQVKKEMKGFESGLAASEAVSLVTGDLQESVAAKFKNITGFERFEIAPHATSSGAFGPQITIGKRLINDKLQVIYSTSVGTTEEHIIKLKYNLSKNISIVGSRDEIGSTGLDLKYRFEFK